MFLHRRSYRHHFSAFSLVEVVIALGVISIAVVTLVALMSTGLQTVKNPVEQTQAINLISIIYADMKNSPATSAVSSIYGLSPLPWNQNSSGQIVGNVSAGSVNTYWVTQGLKVFSSPSSTAPASAIYRITLRYTRAPGSSMVSAATPLNSSPAPIEALVVVSWPPAPDPFATGSHPRPLGKIESYLTFPRP